MAPPFHSSFDSNGRNWFFSDSEVLGSNKMNILGRMQERNDFGRLPLAAAPGEAKLSDLEIGPLHNSLESRWSEPCWVG